MVDRVLVVDANILIRAVLGTRVKSLIEAYCEQVTFFLPDAALAEAEEHLGALVLKRGGKPEIARKMLRQLAELMEVSTPDTYGEFEQEARERIGARDPEDWPVLACAIALDCPIWTEDTDFFGCGAAIWTSATVDVFLRRTGTEERQ